MPDRSIDDYLKTIRALKNLPSDEALAQFIGVTPDMLSAWRSGASFPTEEMMFAFADHMGVRRKEVLRDLNAWREGLEPEDEQEIVWGDDDVPDEPLEEEFAEVVDDLHLLDKLGNLNAGLWLDRKSHEMAIQMSKPGELVIGSTIVPKHTADELRACYKFTTRKVRKPPL